MNIRDETMGGASLEIAGAVATVRFDRPAARNAMLHHTWTALARLIEVADADSSVRVIVLRGSAGHFGSGNDIAEFGRLRCDPVAARDYGWAMANAMRAVEVASKPVIAAIEGSCYGASVALALAADIRLADSGARFAITPAKLGAVYLCSDHHRLVAAIGPGHARRMIFTAQALDATEAQAIGLVDDVAPPAEFETSLAALTTVIAGGSPYTLHHSKRMLRMAGTGGTPAETEESIGWFVDAMEGPDFAEGVDAFLTKRSPQFAMALQR
jgi:enoyl-CoA hydratase/carnithine racemase